MSIRSILENSVRTGLKDLGHELTFTSGYRLVTPHLYPLTVNISRKVRIKRSLFWQKTAVNDNILVKNRIFLKLSGYSRIYNNRQLQRTLAHHPDLVERNYGRSITCASESNGQQGGFWGAR